MLGEYTESDKGSIFLKCKFACVKATRCTC